MSDGQRSIVRVSYKLNEYPLTLEQFSKLLHEHNKDFEANPHMYDQFTTTRVAPASERSNNVEQQAQEDNLQLSKEAQR